MKIENKTIYRCDFCNKLYLIKAACEKHEKRCASNPDNERACTNCWHLKKEDAEVDPDPDYGTRIVSLFFCNKKKTFLYPPDVEHKGNMFHIDGEGNHPMPRQCDDKAALFGNTIDDLLE